MIRLFRKIRHQLLSEDRFSIYLLYAAGEVVLVVIGILLALQIDNWNDDRKLEKQNLSLVESLKADLVEDTLLIDKHLKLLEQDIIQLNNFIRRMSSAEANVDTLVQIARLEFTPWAFAQVTFNTNTFTSLRSTGNLSTLERWLQKDILELHELQQTNTRDVEVLIRSYNDQITFFNQKYPFSGNEHIRPYSKLSNAIWNSAQFADLGALLNGLIAIKLVTEQYGMGQLKNIQEITKDIMKKLEEY